MEDLFSSEDKNFILGYFEVVLKEFVDELICYTFICSYTLVIFNESTIFIYKDMIVCSIIRPKIKDLGCGNGLCVLRRSVWEQIRIKMPSLCVCWSKLKEIIVLRTKLQIFFKGTFPDSFWWHTGRWLPSCPEWRELMRWHLWYYIIKMYVTHKIWETIYKNHTVSCKGWLPRYET